MSLFTPWAATFAAVILTLVVGFANGMRSSPGPFQGMHLILVAYAIVAVVWVAWAA